MRDLDSAVGRLDNIFMSVYFIIIVLIFAVSLVCYHQPFYCRVLSICSGSSSCHARGQRWNTCSWCVHSLGVDFHAAKHYPYTGLSWLIGGSLSEVLTSIIFLFIKHPYDVGDRVTVGKDTFTVKEIRLLSTVFLDGNACLVQAPNTVLNGMVKSSWRSPQFRTICLKQRGTSLFTTSGVVLKCLSRSSSMWYVASVWWKNTQNHSVSRISLAGLQHFVRADRASARSHALLPQGRTS